MYLANLQEMLAKAEEQEVFIGKDSRRAHPDSQQIIIDLFNALGWNVGRFTPTIGNNTGAWWFHSPGKPASSDAPALGVNKYRVMLEQVNRVPALLRFFETVRSALPCPACMAPAPALINSGGQRQFRLACRTCKASSASRNLASTLPI
jgi:hypothetical protein